MTHTRSAVLISVLAAAALLVGCSRGGGTTGTPTPGATDTVAAATPTATPGPIGASNVANLKAGASFTVSQPVRLVWSRSGALWSVSARRVDAVDPTKGTVTKVFEVQEPETIVDLHDAGIAAVANAQGAVRLVEITGNTALQTFQAGGPVRGGNFFGDKVTLSRTDTIEAAIYSLGTGQKSGTLSGFQTAAPVYAVTVSPDGKTAAWVARGTLQFANVASNVLGTKVQFEDFIGSYAFSPDSQLFATATGVAGSGGALTGRVQLWQPSSGTELQRVEQPGVIGSVAFGPQHLLVTGGDNGATVWNGDTGAKLGTVAGGKVRLAAFSFDGTTLATVADDGSGKVWRAQ
ncbi:MAG: hypothetical protein DWI48_06865 [Chloroflexi bacterium]|nr:MAG: hypothetical protein DWI48_06865 [Chloroflexota bacterium]